MRKIVIALAVLSVSRAALAQSADADAGSEAPVVETPRVPPPLMPEVPKAPATPSEVSAPEPSGHFEFGSYGRVRIASDLRGGTGRSSNITSYGSRIDEDSYAEFELRREDTWKNGVETRVVTTLALFPPFFHFSGSAEQQFGLRNLYVQGTTGRTTLWIGSRMYRGDDIYLLNLWPLDNQNTVGGGVGYRLPKGSGDTTFALHVGMQRLDQPTQTQVIQAVAPLGFGTVDVLKVDRPRVIETLKVTHLLRNGPGRTLFANDDAMGFKLTAYGEAHQLAAAVQRDSLTNKDKALPEDIGFVVGAQLGYFSGVRDGFAHLFVRHARGIAVYDPLSTPTTFANDFTTGSASDTMVALGGNLESSLLGVQWGGYLRFFRDGSEGLTSRQKFDEGTVVVRPHLFFADQWGLAVEGSYQKRRYALVDAAGDQRVAGLTRVAVMPYFSPAGRGSFKRPQLRVIYSVSARDSGARSLYPAEDVFSQRPVEHFLGLSAEWWFNSSSYP